MNREETEADGSRGWLILWIGFVLPRRPWVQKLLVGAFCGSVLVAGAVWWLQRYIASRAVANKVADQLEQVLGVPVWVGRVHLGVHGASLDDVELFQPGSGTSGQPWAVVQKAEVDVSGWDIMHGQDSPRDITLHGATVTFSLDAAGHALTRLPLPNRVIGKLPRRQSKKKEKPNELPRLEIPAIPDLHVRDGRLVLTQQGQRDMVVNHINFDVANDGADLVLDGRVDDQPWGDWHVGGRMNHESQAGTVTLATLRPIHFTPGLVDKIRLVSPDVWQQVQLQGDLPARLAFQFNLTQQTLHYDAVLRPRNVSLGLPLIQLDVTGVHGTVTARDDRVQIESLTGHVAEGQISAKGKVSVWLGEVDVGVHVGVKNVNVSRLPRYWNLPRGLTGHLNGQADLSTVFEGGHATFQGDGHGTISDGHFAALPTGPIYLKLFGDNSGFHFAEPRLALKFWP